MSAKTERIQSKSSNTLQAVLHDVEIFLILQETYVACDMYQELMSNGISIKADTI